MINVSIHIDEKSAEDTCIVLDIIKKQLSEGYEKGFDAREKGCHYFYDSYKYESPAS